MRTETKQPDGATPPASAGEVIFVADQYYILAATALADAPTHVLRQAETFGIFDRIGNVQALGLNQQGVFHEGTRYVSRLELRLGDAKPLLLSSTVRQDAANLLVDLTNPDFTHDGVIELPKDSFHLFRSKFLWDGVCYERIRIRNYLLFPARLVLEVLFDADFADIFEVRGMRRPRRGVLLPAEVGASQVVLGYRGLDGITRRSELTFSPSPGELSAHRAVFDLRLGAKEEQTLCLTLACKTVQTARSVPPAFDVAFRRSVDARQALSERMCTIYSSNEQFNDWVNSAAADLVTMLTATDQGLYPYAGVPWFNTAFGRDGIITALQCLWILPEVARGVLRFLAATQAQDLQPEQDAEPGKILHETRLGEMAALGEIPFGRYYGTIDATPLFLMLAGAYYEATSDLETIAFCWDAIERAITWLDAYGDRDGDGFVEYGRRAQKGLVQQGWKDSSDSVFHQDGSLATGPIALCEVQGYVYAAYLAAARLAEIRQQHPLAVTLQHKAQELQEAFARGFWDEELGTFVLALDGQKRPCRVRASNAGHCLFTGIADEEQAQRVTRTLLAEDSFSGWGIRTLSSREARYNPMSYHNGSVWPHDNALIAMGMAQYGLKAACLRVLTGLMDASLAMEFHRLPELFCGFHRRPGEGPTRYPVACSPQAWAVGAVFMMLQACLGLSLEHGSGRIGFNRPRLPEFLNWIELKNLRLGAASIDATLTRDADDVGIIVQRRHEDVETLIIK